MNAQLILQNAQPAWTERTAERTGESQTWWQRVWSRIASWLMEPIDFPGKTWCLEH
jgi:hypothetical protein